MLSLARSRFLLLSQLIFTVTNASGVILASIYNSRTPDLYPNNAHHKVGWIATLVTAGQVLFSLLVRCARRTRTQNHDSFIESRALLTSPLSTSTHHGSSIVNIGNGSERVSNADYQRTSSSSSTVLGEEDDYTDSSLKNLHDFEEDFGHESPGLSHRSSIRRKSLMSKIIVYLPRQIISYNNILYRVIDRIILPFGFIVIMTGIATLGRFFVCLPRPFGILYGTASSSNHDNVRNQKRYMGAWPIGLKEVYFSGSDPSHLGAGPVVSENLGGRGMSCLGRG